MVSAGLLAHATRATRATRGTGRPPGGEPHGIREGVGGHLEEVLQHEGRGDLGSLGPGIPPGILPDERLLPRHHVHIEPEPRAGPVDDEGQPRMARGQRGGEPREGTRRRVAASVGRTEAAQAWALS